MHTLEPHGRWLTMYDSSMDPDSPFTGKEYNYDLYSENIYGYYIDPAWDYMGSETLYLKILYADYPEGFAIIEFIGEWNDAINNDIMYLKRNIIEHMIRCGINKFVLMGEHVFNFHGSDDCYYEEWQEEVEDGWIVAMNFRQHVSDEMGKYGINNHIFYNKNLEIQNWRSCSPLWIYRKIEENLFSRLVQ